MTRTYQIVKEYNINGQQVECLCDVPTASGAWSVCYNEEQAKKRVAELRAAGHMTARYETVEEKNQWWNNENWIG